MKTFDNQFDLTAYFEGFSAKAYKCPAGVWTIGYGTTRIDNFSVREGMSCTEEEAKFWLRKWFDNCRDQTAQQCYSLKIKMNSGQFYAVSDLAYNIGLNGFPALLDALKRGDIQSASEEFLNAIYAKRKPLMGLLLRRISEYNTFCNGTYIAWEENDPITPQLKSLLLLKNGHNDLAVEMINKLNVT